MHNDSIESLLLRHYGPTAAAPDGLEQRLLSSVHREVREQHRKQEFAARSQAKRISRRSLIRMVALGSAGVSLLSVGVEALHKLETTVLGLDATSPALH